MRLMAVLAAVGALLLLRAAQLRTLGPLLYDLEWVRFASLAWDMLHGGQWPRTLQGWSGLAYMPFAQGTLLPIGGFALLAPHLGFRASVLQGFSVGTEALALGLATWLFAARGGARALIPVLAWLFIPLGALIWQLMPFGNHTEYIWISVALALLLRRPPSRWRAGRWLGALLLLAGAVFAYRAHLLTVLALAAVVVPGLRLGPALGALVGIAGAAAAGLGAAVALLPAGTSVAGGLLPGGTWRVGLYGLNRYFGQLPQPVDSSDLFWWPLFVLGLVVVLLGAASRSARFAGVLLLLQLGAVSVRAVQEAQYLLPPYYSWLLGLGLVATGRGRWRLAAVAVLAVWTVACFADQRVSVQPSTWAQTAGYEPLEPGLRLGLNHVSPELVPALTQLVRAGARESIGVGMGTCTYALRYLGPERSLRPAAPQRCCLPAAEVLAQATGSGDIEQLGIGLWLGCGSEARFERSLRSASPEDREALRGGAERWARDPARWTPGHGRRP